MARGRRVRRSGSMAVTLVPFVMGSILVSGALLTSAIAPPAPARAASLGELPVARDSEAGGGCCAGKEVAPEIGVKIGLQVPGGLEEDVWTYLAGMYRSANKASWPIDVDARLSTHLTADRFVERYFDTPELALLSSGRWMRHRSRDGSRGAGDRQRDQQAPQAIPGPDARALRPVLWIEQRRRRVHFSDAQWTLATVTMDQSTARRWWARAPWTEVAIEPDEVRYAQASPEERRRLDGLLAALRADLLRRFPALIEYSQPRYSEAFDRLEQELPFMRRTISAAAQLAPAAPVAMAVAASGVLLGVGIVATRRLRGRWRTA
jgi:hypothetical protein